MLRSIRGLRRFALPVVLLALALASCKSKGDVTPIKTLLDDPGTYNGKTVRIAGEVTASFSLLGTGGYQVTDDSGSILVVAKTGGAPRVGAKVGIEGIFRNAVTLGDKTAAGIEETGKRFAP
jgi:hypothetical protein